MIGRIGDFLDFVMVKKGSGSKWRRWVYGCLSSTRFFGSNQWLSQRIPCGNQGVKMGRFLIPLSLYTILRLLTWEYQKELPGFFRSVVRGYKRLLFTSLYPWQNLVAETWWYFSGSSVFLGLSNSLNPAPFPHKKVWKLLVPLKVQGILWKVAWSLGGEFLRLIGYRSFILIMHCPLTVALCVTMDHYQMTASSFIAFHFNPGRDYWR